MKKLTTMMIALAMATAPVGMAMAQNDGAATVQAEGRRQGGHGMRHGRRGHFDPARMAEHRAEMLTAMLDLDAHQSTAIREILADSAERARTLFSQANGDRAATREAMQALHRETQERIDALLNPEQRATLDRVREVRQTRMQERREARAARRADRAARGESDGMTPRRASGRGRAGAGPATSEADASR